MLAMAEGSGSSWPRVVAASLALGAAAATGAYVGYKYATATSLTNPKTPSSGTVSFRRSYRGLYRCGGCERTGRSTLHLQLRDSGEGHRRGGGGTIYTQRAIPWGRRAGAGKRQRERERVRDAFLL